MVKDMLVKLNLIYQLSYWIKIEHIWEKKLNVDYDNEEDRKLSFSLPIMLCSVLHGQAP